VLTLTKGSKNILVSAKASSTHALLGLVLTSLITRPFQSSVEFIKSYISNNANKTYII